MKELKTQIAINTSADKIWSVLTNFNDYPNWNPFIISAEGKLNPGQKIKITMQAPGGRTMIFKPTILKLKTNEELRWLGHLIFPGLFDGQHIFEIHKQSEHSVTFIQREKFNGLLVPLLDKMIENDTRRSFETMNQALKKICEK